MRKVFLDDLPKYENGQYKGKVNWSRCIGIRIKFIYDDIRDEIKITNYEKKSQYLIVKYNNKSFKINSGSFLECKLGRILGKITKEFKIEVNQHFKDGKRDLTITDIEYREKKQKPDEKNRIYIKKEKWYKYKCNKCGWVDGWIEESSILYGRGCSCCTNQVAVLGINTIWDTDRWICGLGVSEKEAKIYTRGSGAKIQVRCPSCGKEKNVVVSYLVTNKSIGCSCGDGFSYGHKYIHNLLTQLEINFIDNYRPEWCKYYSKYKDEDSYGEYDFFIEDKKVIIEVDGGFHRKDNKMSGQSKEESEYIDNMKDKLAEENGYKVIRIPYGIGDFRENIFNSELVNIFDISKIDWLKCEEFALKNIVKEVCEYWERVRVNKTTGDVAKMFRLDRHTVLKYIKKGNKLRWCEYDASAEKSKVSKLIAGWNSKKVAIFKNNKCLGIFNSGTDLSRNSEKIFNIKLNQGKISEVCSGNRKTHKGFTFKYIDENQQIAC